MGIKINSLPKSVGNTALTVQLLRSEMASMKANSVSERSSHYHWRCLCIFPQKPDFVEKKPSPKEMWLHTILMEKVYFMKAIPDILSGG